MNKDQTGLDFTESEIKSYCIYLLVRREHSQKELLNKSLAKGFEKDQALTVIKALVLEGWQSDFRYAECYARYRIQKGYGPIWINYELKKNGITGFNLDDVVLKTVGTWIDLLERVYTKKYGHNSFLNRNELAKRSRFLMQRGFSCAMISTFFDHLNIKL
jgi:regulatory protein